MFKNYLTIASRNLLRYKGYSTVNIVGFAMGIACCLLIMLWVQYQFSFDEFHKNIENLHWVAILEKTDDGMVPGYQTPPALGPALKEEFPEIADAARALPFGTQFVKYGDLQTSETVRAVDPSFLQMFTFPFVEGDPLTALAEPRSMVITEDIARKYFGNENPMGKTLTMTINAPYDFRVTGVMKNPPSNSTLQPRILIPFSFAGELESPEWIATWTNLQFYTYMQLRDGVDYTEVSDKISARITQSKPESEDALYLVPFSGIHLVLPSGSGSQKSQVMLFGIVAGIILLIAAINYVNLMTARASKRTKEIGIRKVNGACRSDLVKQFYFESLFHAAAAGIIAFVLVWLMLPVVRSISGAALTLDFVGNPTVPLLGVAIVALTGLLAGTYPALLLSAFRPAKVLKGAQSVGSRRPRLRRALVVIQFAASMILVLATVGIYRQHAFLEGKDLGFDKEQVVVIPLTDNVNFDQMRSELVRNQGVQAVTRATSSLSGIYQNASGFTWEGKDPSVNPEVTLLGADLSFLETFKIAMAEGDFFPEQLNGNSEDKIVINGVFARLMGGGSVVGRTISIDTYTFTVVGVTRDFYFKPLTRAVGPLMMFYKYKPGSGTPTWTLYTRISPDNADSTLRYIGGVWNRLGSGGPFQYHYLETEFADVYSGFESLGRILLYFSALAIIISGLGLFGLTSYMAEQRTKEIGVRKVLGSSMNGIVWLLTRESFVLIVIANCIAIPVTYLSLERWLQQYPYRTDITPAMFLLPMVGLVVIAFISVGFQAFKAARANPVDSLKCE